MPVVVTGSGKTVVVVSNDVVANIKTAQQPVTVAGSGGVEIPQTNNPVEISGGNKPVSIGTGGVQGPPGATGSTGPAGPTGVTGATGASPATGDLHYRHIQAIPSTVWTVAHNLGKFPSATIADSAGTVVVGDIEYVDINTCVLTFSASFSGEAYFN